MTKQELEKRNKELEAELAKARADRSFIDDMTKTPHRAMDMQEATKALGISGFDKNRLYAFLRNEGILTTANHPYQEYIDAGYFAVVIRNSPISYGLNTRAKVLVFPEGLKFIHSLLLPYCGKSIKTSTGADIAKKQARKKAKEAMRPPTLAEVFVGRAMREGGLSLFPR